MAARKKAKTKRSTPAQRLAKARRSEAAKRGWATRRFHAAREEGPRFDGNTPGGHAALTAMIQDDEPEWIAFLQTAELSGRSSQEAKKEWYSPKLKHIAKMKRTVKERKKIKRKRTVKKRKMKRKRR